MTNKEITTKVTKTSVNIRIPISLLVHSQKMRPEEPYQVTDKESMAEWIAENIIDYTAGIDDAELGISEFKTILDCLFHKAYEEGELWLEAIGWND